MKIMTVIGARPQFVKAAVISRLIREVYADRITELVVHTGQHYDENMSGVFFRELSIPKPDKNLEIGSGTHGAMTGRMLEAIEKEIIREAPDWVLVYGDTNSTLAGALAASKLNVSVAHVEAGLRSYAWEMPEEKNRVVTDHLSSVLFCPTLNAAGNLAKEGVRNGVEVVGDVMLDASLYYRRVASGRPEGVRIVSRLGLEHEHYYLATIHRAENTDDTGRLRSIVDALNSFRDLPAVLPLHPRTRKAMGAAGLEFADNIMTVDPVGYLDMIELESNARFIVTDSGGVQKEAYFLKKQCITLRDQTEWQETVDAGWNTLTGADGERIRNALAHVTTPDEYPELYGNGCAGHRILDSLLERHN